MLKVMKNRDIGFGMQIRKSPFFQATKRWGATNYSVYNHMYIPRSFGDPEENLRPISPDGMIGKKCHSTPDCSDDQECVIAGFEGRCVQLQ